MERPTFHELCTKWSGGVRVRCRPRPRPGIDAQQSRRDASSCTVSLSLSTRFCSSFDHSDCTLLMNNNSTTAKDDTYINSTRNHPGGGHPAYGDLPPEYLPYLTAYGTGDDLELDFDYEAFAAMQSKQGRSVSEAQGVQVSSMPWNLITKPFNWATYRRPYLVSLPATAITMVRGLTTVQVSLFQCTVQAWGWLTTKWMLLKVHLHLLPLVRMHSSPLPSWPSMENRGTSMMWLRRVVAARMQRKSPRRHASGSHA